jgi:hypothetical protein
MLHDRLSPSERRAYMEAWATLANARKRGAPLEPLLLGDPAEVEDFPDRGTTFFRYPEDERFQATDYLLARSLDVLHVFRGSDAGHVFRSGVAVGYRADGATAYGSLFERISVALRADGTLVYAPRYKDDPLATCLVALDPLEHPEWN